MSGQGALVPALEAVGFLAGLAAIGVYLAVILRHPHWVRMLNGSGLLLTGLALLPSPGLLMHVQAQAAFDAEAVVVLLIAAVAAQSAAALRNRRAWDGVERRTGLLEGRA